MVCGGSSNDGGVSKGTRWLREGVQEGKGDFVDRTEIPLMKECIEISKMVKHYIGIGDVKSKRTKT